MTDAANVIQSFREGCESYIAKPIVVADLLAKMDDLGLLASHAESIKRALSPLSRYFSFGARTRRMPTMGSS